MTKKDFLRAVIRVGLTLVTLATKPLKLKSPDELTTASGRVGGASWVISSESFGGSARSALWFLAFLASCSRSSAKGLGLAPGAEVDCVGIFGFAVADCGVGAVVEAMGVAKLFEIRATVSLASRKLPVTLKSWLTSWSDFGVGFFRIWLINSKVIDSAVMP